MPCVHSAAGEVPSHLQLCAGDSHVLPTSWWAWMLVTTLSWDTHTCLMCSTVCYKLQQYIF